MYEINVFFTAICFLSLLGKTSLHWNILSGQVVCDFKNRWWKQLWVVTETWRVLHGTGGRTRWLRWFFFILWVQKGNGYCGAARCVKSSESTVLRIHFLGTSTLIFQLKRRIHKISKHFASLSGFFFVCLFICFGLVWVFCVFLFLSVFCLFFLFFFGFLFFVFLYTCME